jgi:hypothetical protein
MGQVVVPREEYLAVLSTLRDQPAEIDNARLPVARLA